MADKHFNDEAMFQGNSQEKISRILLNVEDYHQAAKAVLPKMTYDYYRSGADDELTLQENVHAYRRIKLRPRVFVDVSHHDKQSDSFSVRLLNGRTKCAYPVLIAPTAMQRMADDNGERSTARAAVRASTVMILSSLSTTRIEDVADEHRQALNDYPTSTSQLWFQLYILKDRSFTIQLIQRAEQAGFRALVVTVDACRFGNREVDRRNGFRLPEHMQLENLSNAGLKHAQHEHESALNDFIARNLDASLTWSDIRWLRQITRLPIVVKGIMTGEDACAAVQAGVDGIVVSNHGARQVDTTLSTIEVLPEIVAAIRATSNTTKVDVYIDGGIRRGTDILKALALGADAVLVGRPILWGLAVAGCQGVVDVLDVLKREFELAMMLCGCATLPNKSANPSSIVAMPTSKL
jgi:isopentenyl diphosphate isomerase/L-lactate dehydrogenase-like FMN-dependent dehydrogenase